MRELQWIWQISLGYMFFIYGKDMPTCFLPLHYNTSGMYVLLYMSNICLCVGTVMQAVSIVIMWSVGNE